MEKIFLSVLNMSLTASFVIAAIMLARLPLKKAPKIISYALWLVAGFRLLFPFNLESVFSLLPFKAAPIPPDIAIQAVPRIDSGIPVIDNAISASLPAAAPYASANPLQIWIFISSCVWLIGIAIMLIYSFASIVLLKRRLHGAAHIKGNLYEANNLKTPFVIGLFRPKIYIPAGLTDEERRYIVLHEQTHIRRGDHIVKMLAYFILCLHWFNPLAWAAFILMGADMEMSCDERVMRELGGEIKNAYSLSLVRVAVGRRILNGSPLAFGEGGMKERVKNVLNFKKPSRVIITLAVALVAVLSVGFAVNRESSSLPWDGVAQKSDWPVRDMSFDRVTFGSDRDLIVYRWGREPDSEDVLADETILYYHDPGVIYTPEGGQPSTVPGSAFDVTYYLGRNDCMYKKNLHGVYRIDIEGGNPGAFEMTGREQGNGKLSGVLAQYGGPNAVERDGDNYILWYYHPDDNDKRLWFEVKDGELTGRMGIVCLCDGEGEKATDAVEQLVSSISHADGQILFQIPPRYYKPFDWNIHISGHAEPEDGFGMSVHEFEDVNENHSWEAGQWYTIPTEGRNLTELSMDIYLPDENGNMIEKSADLLAMIPYSADMDEKTQIGIIPNNLDVPDVVLAAAVDIVKGDYEGYRDIGIAARKDYGAEFDNWRLDYLEHEYSYDDMNIEVYRFEWRIHTTTPDIVRTTLVGGMDLSDDGWLLDTYPNSWRLLFENKDDELVYLFAMMENDCAPGDDLFTSDMLNKLGGMNQSHDIEDNSPFSDQEVAAAKTVVEKYFKAWADKDEDAWWSAWSREKPENSAPFGDWTISLKDLRYNPQDSMRESYVKNGRGSVNNTSIENVIVFKCDFNVHYPDGIATSAFNEGDYTNWSVILIRQNAGAEWFIDDNGY